MIMTVNPGFAGQSFLPEMLPKIRRLREPSAARGLDPHIEVDGGQNREHARQSARSRRQCHRRRIGDLRHQRLCRRRSQPSAAASMTGRPEIEAEILGDAEQFARRAAEWLTANRYLPSAGIAMSDATVRRSR